MKFDCNRTVQINFGENVRRNSFSFGLYATIFRFSPGQQQGLYKSILPSSINIALITHHFNQNALVNQLFFKEQLKCD